MVIVKFAAVLLVAVGRVCCGDVLSCHAFDWCQGKAAPVGVQLWSGTASKQGVCCCCLQVRDRIEKENVSGQPKGDLPPLPPPGQKIDIKVTLSSPSLPCCSATPCCAAHDDTILGPMAAMSMLSLLEQVLVVTPLNMFAPTKHGDALHQHRPTFVNAQALASVLFGLFGGAYMRCPGTASHLIRYWRNDHQSCAP